MEFKIDKKESALVKCIRFPEELILKINKVAIKKEVTFSYFVIQACNYALDNLEEKSSSKEKYVDSL